MTIHALPAALLACVSLLGLAAHADIAVPLASAGGPVSEEQRLQLEADPYTMRWRAAHMDGGAVFGASAGAEPIAFKLFGDVEVKAQVRSAKMLDGGSRFLAGALEDGGHFTLFRHATGIVRGEFHSSRGVYTLRSHGPGQVVVKQQDVSKLPGCGGALGQAPARVPAPVGRLRKHGPSAGASAPVRALLPASAASEGSKPIDVLVLYTQRVEDHEGGPAQARATIENEMAKTNQVLENSGLSHRRMRLAAIEKVDYEQGEHLGIDIDNLSNTSADNDEDNDYSALDEVFPLIEKHKADLVHLLVRDIGGVCGVADSYSGRDELDTRRHCSNSSNHDLCLYNERRRQWAAEDRFAVTAVKCTINYTFTHELGHNLGLFHNREDYLWKDYHDAHYIARGYFPFLKPHSFGYIDPNMTEDCKGQDTVMATIWGNRCGGGSQAITLPYFSNPDLFFPPPESPGYYPFQPNTPMGVPGDEFTSALDGPVNAARAIEEAWDTVASLSEPPATSLPAWWRRSCAEGDVATNALSSRLPATLPMRPSGEATRFAFSLSAPHQCANYGGARLRVRSLGLVQGLARPYRAPVWRYADIKSGLEPWKDDAAFGVAVDAPRQGRQRLSVSAEAQYGACGVSRRALATVELVHTVDAGITLKVAGVPRMHMALEQGSGRPYCEGAPVRPLRHMGDFNGDGRADVLLRHADGRWHYYPMDGAKVLPGAGAASLPRNPAVAVVGVGDLNGDGRDDVLMRLRSGTWRYYPMNGRRVVAGRGAVALPKDTAWQLEGIGDFNDDGKDDVLLRRRGGRLVRSNGELQNVDEWRYYPMDGRRVLEGGTPALLEHNFGDWVAGVGDFDDDGRDDVLFRLSDGGWYYLPFDGPVGGESTVLPGAGETGGIYVSERVVALPEDMAWSAAGIADFDGDGKDDVLLRHDDGRWRYQPMNGRHVLSGGGAGELPADPEVWLAGVGDMDGDGKAEVLTRRGHGAWRTYHMDPASGALVAGGEVELASGSAWGVLKGGLEDPPRVSAAMPDQPIAIDGEATIDLSAYFAGGGALAYSAAGDADVVGASVAGNILTLAAAASGHATVTVTAQGAGGYFVRQTFRVAVSEDGVAGRRIKDCAECPVVVAVPAGSFMMGAPEEEEGSLSDERPVHQVDIPAFAIGIHEVTFAQWDACVAGGGCDGYEPFSGYHGEARANRPVQELSWHDAQGYVAWLSAHTGEAYRLPSEAEWEYAARAGTTTPFHFGETMSRQQAHYGGGFDGVEAVRVGSFPANAWGLHDVHGNISEWTEDCAYGHYADTPTDGSAWETDDCADRVVRGGNWSSLRASVRSASRAASPADERLYRQNGLRVVRGL